MLIIGILAAVALPQYTKAVEKSRTAEAMQMLGDIATAEQIRYMAANSFTNNLGLLDLSFPNVSGSAKDTVTTNSYKIIVGTPAGTGSAETITVTAERKDGAYSGEGLYLKIDATGKISRGFLSGTATINGLVPQWATSDAATDISANEASA